MYLYYVIINYVANLKISYSHKPSIQKLKWQSYNSQLCYIRLKTFFVFPFPIQWNSLIRSLKISKKLLRYYWLAVVYKLFRLEFLSKIDIQSLLSNQYQCGGISLPILFTNVFVLLFSAIADATFVCTSDEIVNSFTIFKMAISQQWNQVLFSNGISLCKSFPLVLCLNMKFCMFRKPNAGSVCWMWLPGFKCRNHSCWVSCSKICWVLEIVYLPYSYRLPKYSIYFSK